MLEKTAASLEPCLFPRVVSCAIKSGPATASARFRSSRRLPTAFWHHGAPDVQLNNACQADMHGVGGFDATGSDVNPGMSSTAASETSTALRASTFLPDFLCPNMSVACLRRLPPIVTERPLWTFGRLSPRLYTSSSYDSTKPQPDQAGAARSTVPAPASKAQQHHDTDVGRVVDVARRGVPDRKKLRPPRLSPDARLVDAMDQRAIFGVGRSDVYHDDELKRLLSSEGSAEDDPADADRVWFHYSSLDDASKPIYLGQTLMFLSKTGRVADAWKISELLRQVDPSEWNMEIFLAGIKAALNLQNDAEALEIFAKGLDSTQIFRRTLIQALDLVLASALRASSQGPQAVEAVWAYYQQMQERLGDLEGIADELFLVAEVPDLAETVLDVIQNYINQKMADMTSDEHGEGLDDVTRYRALLRLLARRAVLVCNGEQSSALLKLTNDPGAYEKFIRHKSSGRDRWGKDAARSKQIIEAYKHYRSLDGCSPTQRTLGSVFHAYQDVPMSASTLADLQGIWEDWHLFYGLPSAKTYLRFMAFYAAQGDKDKVFKLWKDFVVDYSDRDILSDLTFVHLLQVHAVRRELAEVQRIFYHMESKFGVEPSLICWNILLKAHTRVHDYEGAIDVFERLDAAVGADSYSFATLMRMSGSRGDLGFTYDLYDRARRKKLVINEHLLGPLVEAYCENNLLLEAQDVCAKAAAKGIRAPRMWNTLLHAHALRRDLASIHRVLNLMTEANIPYDTFTYSELLMGLSLCSQPQHALHLLAVALDQNAFEVTPVHFHIIMGAFIKTKEFDVTFRVYRLMLQCGFKRSAQSLRHLSTAFSHWSKLPRERRLNKSSHGLLRTALRLFYKLYKFDKAEARSDDPDHIPVGQYMRNDEDDFLFGKMIYIFTQMKDFMVVGDLVRLYHQVAQVRPDNLVPMSIRVLSAIMWADLREEKHERVRESWYLMFNIAKAGGVSADPPSADAVSRARISKRVQYRLSDGLKVMIEMYLLEGDLDGLNELVLSVREADFMLDSKNWNAYVQALVKLKAYSQAFEVCERWLMPNWTGWMRVRVTENVKNLLPLELRRRGTSPRYLRPTTHTLYYLAKGYMELDKMGPWSVEASKQLSNFAEKYPLCHRALTTMVRVHSQVEKDILDSGTTRFVEGRALDEDGDDVERMY